MTWALHSLCRPSAKSALTHHLPRRDGGTACGSRAPFGGGSARGVLLCQYIPADANGGLCIGRSCSDALGAWGPSATNKLRRVYTGALLAHSIGTPAIPYVARVFCNLMSFPPQGVLGAEISDKNAILNKSVKK